MANKTIRGALPGYDGTTPLYAIVTAESGATSLNGSGGDTVTFGAFNSFSFVWTEAITGGIYDVQLYKVADNSEYTERSKVAVAGDIAGTYIIGSVAELNRSAFAYQAYPPVTRSVDDTNAIRITTWPVASATLSGTVSIDGGTAQNIAGAFSYIGTLGSYYEYNLAYNAADRPTSEGTARYAITDGTNTRYITLQATPSLGKVSLIGTAQGVVLAPVTASGELNPIIRGDDYLASIGRAFRFNWTPPTGFVLATSTCKFGGISACDGVTVGWNVSGTITEDTGVWELSFDIGKSVTAALADDKYSWSVEVTNASGYETTAVKSNEKRPALVINKQT